MNGIIATFTLVVVNYPWFAIPLVVIYSLSVYLAVYFQRTIRDVRRLATLQVSMVSSSLQEGLSGVMNLRIYKQENVFRHTVVTILDRCSADQMQEAAVAVALTMYLNTVNLTLLAIAGVLVMLPSSNIAPNLAGVVLASCLNVLGHTRSLSAAHAEVEKMLHAVERLHYYATSIPQEAALLTDVKLHANWPESGRVRFEGVQFRYDPQLPLVLKDFTLDIQAGEKIGLVGRTGAGKSSLISTLFRMVENAGGRVLIDDVDIATIGLETLRSSLSIIPQDPLLFEGDIRKNLDPFGHHSEGELQHVLTQVNLSQEVEKVTDEDIQTTGLGLGDHVDIDGTNLSLGQQQQLSLARALLHHSKLVLLDEATSAVDTRVDDALQQTMMRLLAGRTIISVAHRLRTVLGFDRIVVMDDGRIDEVGPPLLLFDQAGSFHAMCEASQIRREDIETARDLATSATASAPVPSLTSKNDVTVQTSASGRQ